jgi:tripartite-type tricarboxylate transporter receptor subunit TctC
VIRILNLLVAAWVSHAAAQDYPTRPVKIIVPYAAGGVPDVLSRAVAQPLSEALGHQFIVENKPGAGGIAAVMAVVTAPADGYTLVMADASQTAINPYLFKDLPYDTLKNLTPVSVVAMSTQYVAGNPRFASFADLIAEAKANPGKLSYGSSGIGSVHHIGVESINASLGISMVHVPYRGSGQSVPALVGGEVHMVMASLPALVPHVKSGKIKLLAITSPKRSSQTPDVPAVAELIPGYDFVTGIGLLGPAGMPPQIVSKLAAEVAKAVKLPNVTSRLIPIGLDPYGSTPAEFTALIERDLKKYSTAVKISGAKVN